MMSKVKMIEQIGQLNLSARAEFLAEFNEAELLQYLTNLEAVWSDFQDQFYRTAENTFNAETEQYEPVLMAG
jgi:hypothetical protein